MIGKIVLIPANQAVNRSALAAELDSHPAWDDEVNRKKGSTRKTAKTLTGAFELVTTGGYNGLFEPHLVKKYQTTLSDKIGRKTIGIIRIWRYQHQLQRRSNLSLRVSGFLH